ncbi:DUF2513 domain-containing protein [Paraburkholderia humisilvae]|uniref:DUF2513 domain-containing protein n=1 Tax=Paraburkholderia humisilvae TaxID=627669 RepID=A0A6J5F6J8_9BURK|nr:DUF2513 domain-containing protein [Paraburkholderia humisilvae]CAB3774134.1 hypothetical protein LMG29542_07603 [Paraburkholderia humisilvae]
MDLIRELLLKLEALPVRPGVVVHLRPDTAEVQVDGYDTDQIEYHLSLIEKAGLIDTGGVRPMMGIGFRSLSWSGHDFLDSVRSPDVWDKTKQVASAAGGFTVELLVFAAKTYLEGKIKGLIGG